ncbi:hypothetical protein [uncultured Lutibacter sp.]|uniref:hypothetical protein n=1 Tax=uncultured Lutibacter sp. TaxID=437739 RepID=UPI002618A6B0|nr:hypothetical protein [uncultured Lutibacter sp.]
MEREELHIKLLKYLIKKDGGFGFVQIREFLLDNFEDGKELEGRVKMKRLLDFMESENYIEKMPDSQNGIWIFKVAGKIVERKDISSIIKITPKGVELANKYKNDKFKKTSNILALSMSAIAIVISFFSYKNSENKDYLNLEKKIDSIRYDSRNNQLEIQYIKQSKKDTTLIIDKK